MLIGKKAGRCGTANERHRRLTADGLTTELR